MGTKSGSNNGLNSKATNATWGVREWILIRAPAGGGYYALVGPGVWAGAEPIINRSNVGLSGLVGDRMIVRHDGWEIVVVAFESGRCGSMK